MPNEKIQDAENKDTENKEGVETPKTEPDTPDSPEVNLVTLTELISDKDKELSELRGEVDKLKKANAQMVVQLTAGRQETEDIGKTIVDFCDTRKASRLTDRKE